MILISIMPPPHPKQNNENTNDIASNTIYISYFLPKCNVALSVWRVKSQQNKILIIKSHGYPKLIFSHVTYVGVIWYCQSGTGTRPK